MAKHNLIADFEILNAKIISCARCERLVAHREEMARVKRRKWLEWEYWAKPVAGFGDSQARVLLLGLAPGAHGSNRTGRPFTGDASGSFLFPVLYETGFASQPIATDVNDGMRLQDAYVTSVVRCAPPGNKPAKEEIENCSGFLDEELAALKQLRVVVALGKVGFEGYLSHLRRRGVIASRSAYKFAHGAEFKLPNGVWLVASYHPSQQNTQTGKLTKEMFTAVFRRARELAR
ncbi:MAG: uracil-DNA glycosylase [Acidobacteriaceae bacterium]